MRKGLLPAIILLAGAGVAPGSAVVVDNDDAGFSILSGTWNTGTSPTPWGSNYRWRSTVTGVPTGEVQWLPSLVETGYYDVSVWYVAGSNRSADAPFTVDHAAGSSIIRVNQQTGGSAWFPLGRFLFTPGTGRVRLNNSASGDVVIADAVRFELAWPVKPSDFDGDGDVDQDDLAHFQSCLTGPAAGTLPAGCLDADLDDDGDVDQSDFGQFQACLVAPNTLAGPGCTRSYASIPPRPSNAMTGSAFIAEVTGLPQTAREQRILQEIGTGNLPEFLRLFKPVTVSAQGPSGTVHQATYRVSPDYLAVGSDADFVRMPMMPLTAQSIADQFGCVLPTRKMVNDIYAQAAVKLAPHPFSPTVYDIISVEVFYLSHLAIEEQRAGQPLGLLVGGVKKDVVITPQLASLSGRVAIYGWHQLNGVPIQPLYLGHDVNHVDYSHGIRLVAETMEVDGATMRVIDVAGSAELSSLISDEGAFTWPRY